MSANTKWPVERGLLYFIVCLLIQTSKLRNTCGCRTHRNGWKFVGIHRLRSAFLATDERPVGFESWRRLHSYVCRLLGLRKCLKLIHDTWKDLRPLVKQTDIVSVTAQYTSAGAAFGETLEFVRLCQWPLLLKHVEILRIFQQMSSCRCGPWYHDYPAPCYVATPHVILKFVNLLLIVSFVLLHYDSKERSLIFWYLWSPRWLVSSRGWIAWYWRCVPFFWTLTHRARFGKQVHSRCGWS